MSEKSDSVLSAALNLSEPERFVVLDGLLASLPATGIRDADSPELPDELKRRSTDGSAGLSWEQVKLDLQHPRE